VEAAIKCILDAQGGKKDCEVRLLDIGAGTGAIGLALLTVLPKAYCLAIDINPKAVELSQHNAQKLGVAERYQCLLCGIENLYEQLGQEAAQSFDLIVSNPPYIPEADMAGLEPEVKNYEDRGALCGGQDGGNIIRAILKLAPTLLEHQYGLGEVWMEVDVSHPERMESWLAVDQQQQSRRLEFVEWRRDLAGRPRFCRFRLLDSDVGKE